MFKCNGKTNTFSKVIQQNRLYNFENVRLNKSIHDNKLNPKKNLKISPNAINKLINP